MRCYSDVVPTGMYERISYGRKMKYREHSPMTTGATAPNAEIARAAGYVWLPGVAKSSQAPNHYPIDRIPRRCGGYVPRPDEPDQRPGQERWPGLTQKGGNVRAGRQVPGHCRRSVALSGVSAELRLAAVRMLVGRNGNFRIWSTRNSDPIPSLLGSPSDPFSKMKRTLPLKGSDPSTTRACGRAVGAGGRKVEIGGSSLRQMQGGVRAFDTAPETAPVRGSLTRHREGRILGPNGRQRQLKSYPFILC